MKGKTFGQFKLSNQMWQQIKPQFEFTSKVIEENLLVLIINLLKNHKSKRWFINFEKNFLNPLISKKDQLLK